MPNASSCACKSCGPSCKCGAQTPKAGECCCGPVCTCGPSCDCPASCGCQARREEAKRLGGGERIRLGVFVDSPGEARVRDAWLVLARGRPAYLNFLRRRLPVGADAEDILQLAWMRAARHLDDLHEEAQLEPWFWRILRNTLSDEHRRLGRERNVLAELSLEDEIGEPAGVCGCSLSVLAQIRPEYRDMIRRADLDEEPMQLLADGLGITVGNASVRLHRARKAMREALRDHCGVDGLRSCQDCGCEDDGVV